MYAHDTPLMKMNAYDYDGKTGDISNKRTFVDLEVICMASVRVRVCACACVLKISVVLFF